MILVSAIFLKIYFEGRLGVGALVNHSFYWSPEVSVRKGRWCEYSNHFKVGGLVY